VKILILKPSSLGDVIHALPVLRLLLVTLLFLWGAQRGAARNRA